MGCFTSILLLAGFVFVGISLIRWFEQTADAVDARAWRQLLMLLAFPFSVWFFPSRISAGRPTPVPLHEPVRGFGTAPIAPPPPPAKPQVTPAGTGPPPPLPKRKSAIDPAHVAKLKEKMRQQGMLPPEE